MAGGKASQKPDAGINTTPRIVRLSRLQPSDRGSIPSIACSNSHRACPKMKSRIPNRTNHATAPTMGSLPTLSKRPFWIMLNSTLPNRAKANTVWMTDTPINQGPIQYFMILFPCDLLCDLLAAYISFGAII
jgi:hypothetical protein